MKSARQELAPEVARLVGGDTLHVAMRHTAGPLSKILATVGPRRWVMGNDDIMVPWIHAWAQEATLSASPILAEHALDLLLERGCVLDAEDREGRRAIELIEPDHTIIKVNQWGHTHRINHASALIGMLLERGARWEDLEYRGHPQGLASDHGPPHYAQAGTVEPGGAPCHGRRGQAGHVAG